MVTIVAKIHFRNVDEYIAAQPDAVQVSLARVRSAIRKALPRAEEAYKLDDEIVLYFAGWKSHYSLYPAGERLIAVFKDQLAAYTVNKGTIRFPLSEPVPVKLIGRIAKYRAKDLYSAKSKGRNRTEFEVDRGST